MSQRNIPQIYLRQQPPVFLVPIQPLNVLQDRDLLPAESTLRIKVCTISEDISRELAQKGLVLALAWCHPENHDELIPQKETQNPSHIA